MSSASGVKGVLQAVAAGQRFTPEAMIAAVDTLTSEGTPAQMAAFLMGLRVRGETVDEIAGAARAMREKMTAISVVPEAIDIVGTGGDGHGTFNVSTGAAIVAAGAGLKVAKHGNRSVSSLSGASDILSALGVKLDCDHALVARAVDEAGVGFLWAPQHHPAFKTWGPARGAWRADAFQSARSCVQSGEGTPPSARRVCGRMGFADCGSSPRAGYGAGVGRPWPRRAR